MKKIIPLILFTLTVSSLFAQRVINNPKFSATTDEDVKITKIELTDDFTKIDFEVKYFPKWWIKVSKKDTYIQNSKGGKKLYVKRAEGIELDKEHFTPESGINIYTLYFPVIDKNTEFIDYIESSWKIFDINVSNKIIKDIIPKELQGNWLKTDGSNQWVYGFYENKVVYDNTVWTKVAVNKKAKNYVLNLTNSDSSKHEQIFVKQKRNRLMIGYSLKNMQAYSTAKTFKKNYKIKNDEAIQLPVFKKDTAIYKGFIKGFHPKMDKVAILYFNNILMSKQNSIMTEIKADGSFEFKIPTIYPQKIYFRFSRGTNTVFIEPGETTFQYIDLSEYTKHYKNRDEYDKRERKSLFSGTLAKVNTDLMLMDTIRYFNYDKVQAKILDMSGEEYKKYCLDIMRKEQEAFNKYLSNHNVSKKAAKIMGMEIKYRAYKNILSYNINRENAYRKKHNISYKQRDIPLEKKSFLPEYYNFINADDLNNPMSLCINSYDILINRIEYNISTEPKPNLLFATFKGSLNAAKVILSKEESDLLDTLISCKSNKYTDKVIKKNSDVWNRLVKKSENINQNIFSIRQKIKIENLKKYYGLNDGLVTDIVFSISKCVSMVTSQKPLTVDEEQEIKQTVTNDFIRNYLLQFNDDMEKSVKAKREANKIKTGYVVNKTPKAAKDKLFAKIIEKYKGKVIYLDFWATWCSPCRIGIKKIEPLKKELKGKDIVFLYITNESSPLTTWELLIPDIKGEHYRLSRDEWEYITDEFKVVGIPHYVLIDKTGKVVTNNIRLPLEILKLRIEEYINE